MDSAPEVQVIPQQTNKYYNPAAHVGKHSGTRSAEFNARMSDLLERNPFDQTSKISFVNMLPDALKIRFNSFSVQEYMRLGEEGIEKKLNPDVTLKRLRVNLWNEFAKMQDAFEHKGGKVLGETPKVGLYRICYGVCYPSYLTDKVIHNDLAVSYLFTPPVSYEVAVREGLDHGVKRIREILSFPIYKETVRKDGTLIREPDVNVANIILKAVAILDLRIHGSVPQVLHQRVESKSINYNMNESIGQIDNAIMDIEDLDKRIKEIREETNTIINNPAFDKKETRTIYTEAEKF